MTKVVKKVAIVSNFAPKCHGLVSGSLADRLKIDNKEKVFVLNGSTCEPIELSGNDCKIVSVSRTVAIFL